MADKKKITLSGLLMNNKVVLFVSLFISIILWVVISMTVSPEDTRVIENVKVTLIQEEESGYQAFGFEDTYVDVTVKGRRYLISSGALSADDITITATSGYVDSSGTQKLKLNAEVNNADEINIISLSKNAVSVFYDTPKTAKFPVTVKLNPKSEVVPDGYINEEPIASISTVTVTGPATEINKIEKFESSIDIKYPLSETTVLEGVLESVTTTGKQAKYITFEENVEDFNVTVPVYMVKEIPVVVKYLNRPSYYENNMPEVNIYPSKVKVAAAKSVLDEMNELIVGTVDFSQLQNKNNTFTFSSEDIEEVKLIEDIKDFKVDINCWPMSSQEYTVPNSNITAINIPDGYTAEVKSTKINNVVAIGKSDSLSKLDNTRMFAKVDLTDIKGAGKKELEAIVYIKDCSDCWIYGKYSVIVKITKNS